MVCLKDETIEKSQIELLEIFKKIQKLHGNTTAINDNDEDNTTTTINSNNEDSKINDGQKQHMKHNTIKFTTPLSIRIPIPNSMLYSIYTKYCKPNINNKKINILSKAYNNGGRYDSYIDKDNINIYFASIYNAVTCKYIQKKDENIPLERHHIIHLKKPPQLIACPLELLYMQRKYGYLLDDVTVSNDIIQARTNPINDTINANEPFTGILKFSVESVTSTYVYNCLYTIPSNDEVFRKREVDFFLRNILFGLNLPMPIPYTCSR